MMSIVTTTCPSCNHGGDPHDDTGCTFTYPDGSVCICLNTPNVIARLTDTDYDVKCALWELLNREPTDGEIIERSVRPSILVRAARELASK